MPTEIRLKPSPARNAIVSAPTLRGSTSIETSASGANAKPPRSIPISIVISSRARNVGVPPPQCSCSTRGPPSTSAAHDLDLAADVLDVLGRAPVVLGDDLVARAVVADRVAERDVHVQRQRRRRPLVVARGERVDVVLGLDAGVKAISSGVRGVARTESVVFLHQGGVEDEVGCGGIGHGGSR